MVRKAFTPTEEVAIWRALEPEEREAAKDRQSGLGRDRCGKLPQRSKSKTRDRLGAFVGKSGRTLEKQVALVEAAEAEPEKYGKLVADMDRTGRVEDDRAIADPRPVAMRRPGSQGLLRWEAQTWGMWRNFPREPIADIAVSAVGGRPNVPGTWPEPPLVAIDQHWADLYRVGSCQTAAHGCWTIALLK